MHNATIGSFGLDQTYEVVDPQAMTAPPALQSALKSAIKTAQSAANHSVGFSDLDSSSSSAASSASSSASHSASASQQTAQQIHEVCKQLRQERDKQAKSYKKKCDELFLREEENHALTLRLKQMEEGLRVKDEGYSKLQESLTLKEGEWKRMFHDMERGQLSLVEGLESEAVERAKTLEKK